MQPGDCESCWGDGRVVRERKGIVPFKAWANLPLPQSVALIAGLVKPETCPDCFGCGRKLEALKAEIVSARLDRSGARPDGGVVCTKCYGAGYVHKTLDPSTKWEGVLGKSSFVEMCAECRRFTQNQIEQLHKALCGCEAHVMDWSGPPT